MADGPSHYKEAEGLLAALDELIQGASAPTTPEEAQQRAAVIAAATAQAQVHATLALAAATAQLDAHEGPGGGSRTGRTLEDVQGWDEAFANGRAVSR